MNMSVSRESAMPAAISQAVWGKHDPFVLPAGAESWKRDIPQADIHLYVYDTGHFALETHSKEIVPVIRDFLDKHLK